MAGVLLPAKSLATRAAAALDSLEHHARDLAITAYTKGSARDRARAVHQALQPRLNRFALLRQHLHDLLTLQIRPWDDEVLAVFKRPRLPSPIVPAHPQVTADHVSLAVERLAQYVQALTAGTRQTPIVRGTHAHLDKVKRLCAWLVAVTASSR